MSGRLLPLVVALVLFAGCAERFAPAPLPEGAVPYGAPPAYRQWWTQVEACSGARGGFDRVRWFVVPGTDPFLVAGHRDDGLWIEHYRYIVLAESRVNDSLLVRHEMLHDLLGRLDHPATYFEDRCRDVVRP